MSTKSKLIIGIVLLAVGAGLVPTGLVVNDYLINEVYEGIPEAMTKIKNDAVPALMERIPKSGTPEVLTGVKAQAIPELELHIPVMATPEILDELRDEALVQLPFIINGSGVAKAINGTLYAASLATGMTLAKENFFNSPTFQDNYTVWLGSPVMMGVSNYWDGILAGGLDILNLSYSTNAQDFLLNGNLGLPGLITDLELGFGVLGFMELYLNASLGDMALNLTMQAGYNATWNQIELLAGYIQNYLWDVIVAAEYSGMTIEEYAEIVFHSQWANGTIVEDGIDLSLFYPGLPPNTKGLEAGIPIPTNITIASCMGLWEDSNILSFVNDTGIEAWMDPAYMSSITTTFGIDTTQYTMILSWLGDFMTNLVPMFLLGETGYTIPELAVLAFYEQWANGTIFGNVVLPFGFLAMINSFWAGAPYFEVGLPTASGLSLTETMNLWDAGNEKTFLDSEGFENYWINAMDGDAGNKTALITEFGISAGELDATLTWLANLMNYGENLKMADGRIADLIEYDYGMSLTQIATSALYEQWSEGTVFGQSILPDGFLSLRTPPIPGPPYFEVGLTSHPLSLTTTQRLALWDDTSEYSLLTVSGVKKWYQAEIGNEIFATLQIENGGLAPFQMIGILDWIPQFRDYVVNKLAKDDRNLPMEPYDLGQTLSMSLGLGGGALAALGVVFLILSRRS
ncbi:MAG: hypothetical protein ACFFAG_07575 [Promethearchaeota archaeon]